MLSYKDAEKYLFGCDHATAIDVSSVDYTPPTGTVIRRIFVGAAGTVKIDTPGGELGVSFANVPNCTMLDVHAIKIYHSGTTATSIVALW